MWLITHVRSFIDLDPLALCTVVSCRILQPADVVKSTTIAVLHCAKRSIVYQFLDSCDKHERDLTNE